MPEESRYRGSKEYLLVYSDLINAARCRGTVTYQEIALTMGIPTRGGQMAGATGEMLGEISQEEHAQG